MTTIEEEPDMDNYPLFGLPPLDGDDIVSTSTAGLTNHGFCPEHPNATDCLCNSLTDDWGVQEPLLQPLAGIDEPDYSRFENWIPRFVRPEKPCDYCRSRRLCCYVQRGEPFCTSCATLFRECSLSKSNTLEATNYVDKDTGTFLDTLGLIDEDTAKEQGTLTGIKQLRSKPSGSGSATPVRGDDAPGSTKRNGIRFPRHAVKTLRDWLESHADNPYPTEEEKAELEQQTELKPSQIAGWLANARRRRKVADKARPKLCQSPSLRPTTAAIPIPRADKPWDELNPFERWKHSPPENEPADMVNIVNAVVNANLAPETESASPSTIGRSTRHRKGSSNGSSMSYRKAPSTASQETAQTSSISSSSAAISNNSSRSTHGSFSSFSSSLAGKKDRRRRRKPTAITSTRKSSDDKKRIFQCTFCTDTFKAKYDWTRHEKSLHLSFEKWICAPLGPIVTDGEFQSQRCVYCGLHNPSRDHIESHNHRQCEDKGSDARTFYRKDHLRQHLRLMHGCEMTSEMDGWKSIAININSRCGFCSQRFTVWQERVDHLTAHFKAGARMSEWKGCRGLDPAVAAQVTNAMPPYLIGMESVSPNPFSATNRSSWRNCDEFNHHVKFDPQTNANSVGDGHKSDNMATCWEILTVRLGKYAKDMSNKGVLMTDDMLQTRARQILYGSDDTWNQTAADNLEWLDLFKKAHGLNFIPSAIGGQGNDVPEDLETYSDLGLRVPFAVQLQAYNQVQTGRHDQTAATRPGPYEQARTNLKAVYSFMSTEGVLYDGEQKCEHMECRENHLALLPNDTIQPIGSNGKRWCNKEISSKVAERLATVAATGSPESLLAMQNEMLSLRRLHTRCHQNEESCTSQCDSMNSHSSPGMDIAPQDSDSSAWEEFNRDLIASRARARGLASLTRVEAPQPDSGRPPTAPTPASSQGTYFPRHRYELSNGQARLFATTTGIWEDSGTMPQTIQASLPNINEGTTSTGAMMEFLGGDMGADLPFSSDALTSTIPLQRNASTSSADLDWQLPGGGTVSQEELMAQLTELIGTTTSAEDTGSISGMPEMDMDWMAMNDEMDAPVSSSGLERMPSDMEDVNFDEFTFDGVFDIE